MSGEMGLHYGGQGSFLIVNLCPLLLFSDFRVMPYAMELPPFPLLSQITWIKTTSANKILVSPGYYVRRILLHRVYTSARADVPLCSHPHPPCSGFSVCLLLLPDHNHYCIVATLHGDLFGGLQE